MSAEKTGSIDLPYLIPPASGWLDNSEVTGLDAVVDRGSQENFLWLLHGGAGEVGIELERPNRIPSCTTRGSSEG